MNIKNVKMPESIYNAEFEIYIRPYLTHEEIIAIAETALKMDNLAEIDASVAYNTILFVTDVTEEELDKLTLDEIMYSGLWAEVSTHITNLENVYGYITYEQNISTALVKFINNVLPETLDKFDKQLSEYLEKMSDGGVENISNELSKIMEIVKEDGNAEIIKGALKMGGDE